MTELSSIESQVDLYCKIFKWTQCTVCPGNSDPLYIIVSYYTVCPRSSDPFDELTYYIKWVPTSWTYSTTVCFRSSDPFYSKLLNKMCHYFLDTQYHQKTFFDVSGPLITCPLGGYPLRGIFTRSL